MVSMRSKEALRTESKGGTERVRGESCGLSLFFMRYHDIPPKEWTSYYGSVYRCNHPVYRVCTLYREQGKGLCVIQQRYNEKTKATYWSAIDPWLTDKIYLHEGFRQYFDSHAKKKNAKGEYPTVTVRQIMWALRMKPLKKERWETVFDLTRKILRALWDEGSRKGECNMNESIFKKIWNYSITVGQMIMTAIAMAIVTVIVWLLCRAFRPSKD